MIRISSLVIILMLTTSAAGQKVGTQYDKTVDFTRFKTYSWADGMPARNPIINQMIKDAVDQELTSRGLTKTAAAGDVQVLFSAAVEYDLQVAQGGRGNTGSYVQTGIPSGQAWEVRKGTLAVDVMETSSKNFVWRGLASETLNHAPSNDMQKDAKRVEKTVKKAVTKMFKQFPRARA